MCPPQKLAEVYLIFLCSLNVFPPFAKKEQNDLKIYIPITGTKVQKADKKDNNPQHLN